MGDPDHGLELRLLHSDEQSALGSIGPVFLAETHRPPTLDSFTRFKAHLLRHVKAHPDGIHLVIAPNAPKPFIDPRLMPRFSELWARTEPVLISGASLVRGSGFLMAMRRSVIATVLLARKARGNSDVHVVATVNELCDALCVSDPRLAAERDSFRASLERFFDPVRRSALQGDAFHQAS